MIAQTRASARLVFEPGTHTYYLDGVQKPSVTEILKATGVSTDFAALGAMSDRLRDDILFKRELGTSLHSDIHAFDDGQLKFETVDPAVFPYLEAWATFRSQKRLEPLERERRVYHGGLDYCGTLDGIFRLPNGAQVLIDVKTGDPEDAAAHLQTAGYLLAYLYEWPDAAVSERWSVQLVPTRAVPYVITPYRGWEDFSNWSAIVTTYWQQSGRRRRHV